MIELSHFSKFYGSFRAVDDVSLQVSQGEIFGFIGRNGAGKTTTIRFLATLIRATAGDGKIAGFSVRRESIEVRRHLGYVPDQFGEFSGFRVSSFLDFFGRAYGLSRKQRRARVEQLLQRLGLTDYASREVRKLSRGLKQRLYLARALIHDPPVLILDEPTAGLDPEARLEFRQLLKDLAAQGKTILLSSHVLAELADIATSIGIIERGKLVLSGPIRDVLATRGRHRRVRVRYQSTPRRLEEVLSGLNAGLRVASILDGQAILEIASGEDQIAEILRGLVTSGIDVTEFTPLEPTLEELFVESTGLARQNRQQGDWSGSVASPAGLS